MSFEHLNKAVTRSIEKGLDSKVLVLINPRAWADVLNDQAALRKYDSSYTPVKMENGARSLVFYSNNIDMQVESSIYVKEGYGYMLSIEDFVRVGSSDISFNRPGYDEGKFFKDLENSAGLELRLWSDQALFCSAPGRSTLIKNIVNGASS